MNCLVSTLYVFWKTNPTNRGDYCYLLVYCSSFWHCSSDQGTVVLGTLHLQGEGQVLLGSILGQRRPGRQRVGRGKLSSGNACAVAWVARALGCAPWPPSRSRALSARPFSWDEEWPWWPMLYLCHICWYALFTYALWCSRPSPALVSPALSSGCSHSRGYSSPGEKPRVGGVGRGHCAGGAVNADVGLARVLFLVCLTAVSQDVSVFLLASSSKPRARSLFGWASGGRGDKWSCRRPCRDPAHRGVADAAPGHPAGPPWVGPATTPSPSS